MRRQSFLQLRVAQRSLRIETAKTQRRDKAGQETGEQRKRKTEDENAPVDMNLTAAGLFGLSFYNLPLLALRAD